MTLSEAKGEIDRLNHELSMVKDLVDEASEKSNRMVSSLDEIHQAFKNINNAKKPLTKRQASKMLKDREREARDMRKFFNNISERCWIALKGDSQ